MERYGNIWKGCKGIKIYEKGGRVWKYIKRVRLWKYMEIY